MALSSAYINRFNAPFARSDVAVRKSVLRHVHLKYFISVRRPRSERWLWMKEIILLRLLNIIPETDLRKPDSLLCLQICEGGSRDFCCNYPHLFSCLMGEQRLTYMA